MIKYLTIILVIISFGCNKFSKQSDQKDQKEFILSNSPEINQLEILDHELCTIITKNKDIKNLKNQTNYWKCRINTAKSRIDHYNIKKNHLAPPTPLITKLFLKRYYFGALKY